MSSEKKSEEGDWSRALRDAGPYLGIGSTMAASLLAGLGIGYWMDGRFGTKPLFLLLGAGFGIFAGFYHLFKTVMGSKR